MSNNYTRYKRIALNDLCLKQIISHQKDDMNDINGGY